MLPITNITSEISVSWMHSFEMPIQVAWLGNLLITTVTNIILSSRMHYWMFHQVASLHELAVTNFVHEIPFVHMKLHVFIQGAFLEKLPVTNIAGKFPVSVYYLQMRSQVAPLGKLLVANKVAFSCMVQQMRLQVELLSKSSVTSITREILLPHMYFEMLIVSAYFLRNFRWQTSHAKFGSSVCIL